MKNKTWIITADVETVYDVFGAFDKFDSIWWHISRNNKSTEVGDIVYIYITKKYKKIMFKCEVIELSKNTHSYMNYDIEFSKEGDDRFIDVPQMLLKLIEKYDDERLNINELKERGYNPMGPRIITGELLNYINDVVSTVDTPSKKEAIIDAKDDIIYSSHVDILNNVFGRNYKGHQKARLKLDDNTFIWFPKIEKDKYGNVKSNRSGWLNYYNDDCSIVITEPPFAKAINDEQHMTTLIFIMFGHHEYRFVGAFKKDMSQCTEYKHVNIRIATRVKLIGNPVYKLELLNNEPIVRDSGEIIDPNINYIHEEGSKIQKTINVYERNPKLRELCIKKYGYVCQICKTKLEDIYGLIAKEFVHVHHIKPISEYGENHETDALKDLITVCPNCHAMLHRTIDNVSPTVEELREIIKKVNN